MELKLHVKISKLPNIKMIIILKMLLVMQRVLQVSSSSLCVIVIEINMYILYVAIIA